MTTAQFHAAMAKLNLKPLSKSATKHLGKSKRQLQRIANGTSPVPPTLARLLLYMLIYGLIEEVERVG